MARNAPGKHFRKGMSLIKEMRMFPDDPAAERWFAETRWPPGRVRRPHCGSGDIRDGAAHRSMRFRCRRCRKRFAVRVGTVTESSKLGFPVRALAGCLMTTDLKGRSGKKLHRDLGVTQKTARHLERRIRKTGRRIPTASSRALSRRADLCKRQAGEHAAVRAAGAGGTGADGQDRDRRREGAGRQLRFRAHWFPTTARKRFRASRPAMRLRLRPVHADAAACRNTPFPACVGLPFAQRMCERTGSRRRHRVVPVDVQAGLSRNVSQDATQAPWPACLGIRRTVRRAPDRHSGAACRNCRRHGRQAAALPRLGCLQRASVGGAVTASTCSRHANGRARGPAWNAAASCPAMTRRSPAGTKVHASTKDSDMKGRSGRRPGRPATLEMQERIPDAPENVLRTMATGKPRKAGERDCLAGSRRAGRHPEERSKAHEEVDTGPGRQLRCRGGVTAGLNYADRGASPSSGFQPFQPFGWATQSRDGPFRRGNCRGIPRGKLQIPLGKGQAE